MTEWPIQTVRVSEEARQRLIRLKMRTGIQNWHPLCRMAFIASLRDPSAPQQVEIRLDSNIEMTWETFGGPYQEIYKALLIDRVEEQGLPVTPDNLQQQFRLHIHRGVNILMASDNPVEAVIPSAP